MNERLVPRKALGALIYRRTSDGWWCVDEFAQDGRHLGSHASNWSAPPVRVSEQIAWPKEAVRLAELKIPQPKPRVREGLVRVIDGGATRRA